MSASKPAAAQKATTEPARGSWYVRVINPRSSKARLCVRVYFNPNREPWYGDTIYVARGRDRMSPPPAAEWLAPGESSGWVDIGRHISLGPTFKSSIEYVAPVFVGAMTAPAQGGLRLRIELSRSPDTRPARSIDVSDPHPTLIGASAWLGAPPKLPTLGLLLPVAAGSTARIWTLEEAAAQQLKWIGGFGPIPTPSSHVWFISHQAFVSFKKPSRLERMQTEIVRRLGYGNLINYAADREDLEAMRTMGAEPLRTKLVALDPHPSEQAESLKRAGLWDYVRLVNFGDEIDISLRATPEQQNAAFVADLKSRGFRPLDFIRPEDEARATVLPEADRWHFVRLQGALPSAKPKLLYEAAVFRYRLWTRELEEQTQRAAALFPPGVQTGANFSPHLSVWPDVRKWIDVFRDGGMTMPWSEDWWWQVPEASPQSYGYLLDALRHASDYRGAPYCFYTIPDNGESADHLLRMSYFALGHQAKVIDDFAIYHQAFGTCDYVDFLESREKFRAIHRILSDVGRIDERLCRSRMRPAETAILMPIANDVWNVEDLLTDRDQTKSGSLYNARLNTDNHERKALWLALRHADYPVDLVTDEDVIASGLSRYKAVYLVGQEILAGAAPVLQRWVEAGGTLVASGGAGLLNQYREPLPAMKALLGLEEAHLERAVRTLGPAADLPKMRRMDSVRFAESGAVIPALCYKQNITPADARSVVATYSNGAPAVLRRRVGKGAAILFGALPGLAYLQPAMGRLHGLPEAFPGDIRRLIVEPAESAGVRRDVITSDPLVDATLQEDGRGAIVTLTSFHDLPQRAILVTLAGLPNARSVVSLRHGRLRITGSAQGPTVRLPIDQGDFLLIDR